MLDRVRRSVGAVVPCNVLLTDPLMDYKGTDGHSSYDVIISTLCLEFASLSTEEYSAAVGNVARLLRPSGHFIIQVQHRWTFQLFSRIIYHVLIIPYCISPGNDENRVPWVTVITGTTIINFLQFHSIGR